MSNIQWTTLIEDGQQIDFTALTKVAPTKGNITYEYNPFYNYRISQNMYEFKGNLYSLADLWNNFKVTLKCIIKPYKIISKEGDKEERDYYEDNYDNAELKYYHIEPGGNSDDWRKSADIIICAFKKGRNFDRLNLEKALKEQEQNISENDWYYDNNDGDNQTNPFLREAGELTDFITDELSFDLEHPVTMLPQYSYDGSVNLILNDGKNSPKLINSRFSATGKNTYEVCDRKGNNDTNIYDQGESFTIDTSLYKQTESIAQLRFDGVSQGGALKIGNYHFYFKVADADGNESDFIAESGLVSIFIGNNSYSSVTTGERDEDSHKQVSFQLFNLDSSYDYVHVYYSRYSAENNQNRAIEYKKIDKKYTINNVQICNIVVSGFEPTLDITAEDINLQFNLVDSAYTSAICQNRLFMANVHKPDIPYVELQDLSLRILPYLKTEAYEGDVDHHYNFKSSSLGYIDPKFIYEKTGYWTDELYRFGIVYIMPDNTLSPVFNIRGGYGIPETTEGVYSYIPVYDSKGHRKYITFDEENFSLIPEDFNIPESNHCQFENVKGVVSFTSYKDTNTIFSVNMKIPYEVKQELSKYVKGYFFVRQPRIPFVLAQGITIGINQESHTPTIPTKGGFVDEIASSDLSNTHVTVGNDDNGQSTINDVVYVSEGFLSRYRYTTKPKSSSIWKKIGIAIAITAAVAVAAVATVFTCGAAAAVIGAVVFASVISVPTVAGAMVTAALIDEIILATKRRGKTYNRWNSKIPSGHKVVELEESRKLTNDFLDRIILTASDENQVAGILCPDYEVDQPHFNSIFVSDEHLIKYTNTQSINLLNQAGDNYFENDERHFYMPEYTDLYLNHSITTKIIPLRDNQKVGMIEDMKFRARAGEAEEVYRIESVGASYKSSETKQTDVDDSETLDHRKINSDIIRGSFGPYLAFYDKVSTLQAGSTVNIYTSGYDIAKMEQYIYQRACDNSTYYTISDRFILNPKDNQSMIVGVNNNSDTIHSIYRGDCYLCQFTHRVNRNFQDPSAPFNDQIVDENTWKDNYDPAKQDNLDLINAGDVNAIQMGLWVTFKVRSSNNLNIRTQDYSEVSESAMTNHPRTYYPKTPMSVDGVYKTPDAQVYNAGFKKLLSERFNFEIPDVPWLKNWYGTRIMYSDINVSDSFQNGFRVFKGTNYRDYTREYGEITKIISFESSLLCVFEHGVALIPVNERTVAGDGPGGFAYINTHNVLPENPRIISDVYGSQWADSIIKVPGKFGDNTQYVYGVDTVAKKIWRTDGNTLTCISDRKVQEFLNNNITLSEFELTPKLGIRNVKTFYNAYKRDVLFTFYDNTYGFEEKVWNLCWNELMQQFITFYSWVPSVMENINNIPFSFNRNTTKWLAKLGTSHCNSSFADGVTLTNVVINNEPDEYGGYSDNYNIPYTYTTVDGNEETITLQVAEESRNNLIGVLKLSNRILPELEGLPIISYSLERDYQNNYNIFKIYPIKLKKTVSFIEDDGTLRLPELNGDLPQAKYPDTVTFYGLYFNAELNDSERNELLNELSNYKQELFNNQNNLNNYNKELSSKIKDLYHNKKELKLKEDELKLKEDEELEDEELKSKIKELESKIEKLESEIKTLRENISKIEKQIESINSEIADINLQLNNLQENNPYSIMSEIYYRNEKGIAHADEEDNKLELKNYFDEDKNIKNEYFKDCIFNNYPIFKNSKGYRENLKDPIRKSEIVRLLNIKAQIKYTFHQEGGSLSDDYHNIAAGYESGTSLIDAGYYQSTVALIPKWNLQFLSTDFWRHGQAGIIDIADDIFPTYWYGERHPFEFEFIVANEPGKHKIFDNLQIISNKAEPESFHYEIVGECYDFAKDKKNMYIRQEATKELYQYNGSDITFNHKYNKLEENHRDVVTGLEITDELPYSGKGYDKSTIFPLYYGRQDHINEIYDSYKRKENDGYDYSALSGAELILYNNLSEIRIRNNCEAVNITDWKKGRLRGNMQYKEDIWDVQINPINFIQNNEPNWADANLYPGDEKKVPVELSIFAIPDDIKEKIGKSNNELDPQPLIEEKRGATIWEDKTRKEVKIKDKYLKVRIRYSGEDLAIINAINTLYTISYS